jgi:hypothetical protein
MHTEIYLRKVLCYKTLLVILIFILGDKKSAPWDYENLHETIRRLKANKRYEKILECFSFGILGISPISNDVVNSVFTLTSSGFLLLILTDENESFFIKCSEEKKKAIFSKFSDNDLNLLSEIAEKIST